MDKQTYFKRFSRAARWRLGGREAAEVVADYADLLERRTPEQEETLVEDLGKPEAAARLLTEKKSYHRWLWSFWIMVACLVLPERILFDSYIGNQPEFLEYGLLILGMVLALCWFHPNGKKTRRPRALLVLLAVIAVLWIAAGMILSCLFTGAWENWPPESYGPTAFYVLALTSTVAVALGILGAVRARTDNRRWAALYVLGLTTVLICLQIVTMLMTLDAVVVHWLRQESIRWAVLGGIGLVGTGVVLC